MLKPLLRWGGVPVLFDLDPEKTTTCAAQISEAYAVESLGLTVDITQPQAIESALERVLEKFNRIDILINNAANNPKVEDKSKIAWSRLENFSLDIWNQDIATGLTGAFLCSQIIGRELAKRGGGVILNVASDLALIGPDQRIYQQAHLAGEEQPVKPITYSVVKSALLGLTRYLATYWADKNVRANAICPGGVKTNQPPEFVERLTQLIPMGRMAHQDEYKAAIIFFGV